MAVRQIIVYDSPLLRQKSRKVRRVGATERRLIEDMFEAMRSANGIGLAAVQVGVPERVVVVEVSEDDDEDNEGEHQEHEGNEEGEVLDRVRPKRRYAVINAEIARASCETEEGVEGCLSVPGLVGEVSRHAAITVKGLDAEGHPVRIKAEGLLARVFQHEIDHCEGTLFIDHITDPEKLWPVAVGQEEAAEAAQQVPGRERPEPPLV